MYAYSTSGSTWDGDDLVDRRVFEALSRTKDGGRVLDAGCGNGYLASLLAERGFSMAGVNTSAEGVAVARNAHPHITFLRTDLIDPPIRLPPFDAITCVEVIEHVYAPRQFLANIRRLLQPGSTLVLTTPYHGYLKNLAIAATGKWSGHFNPLWDDGHITFFTKASLATLLTGAGFVDVTIQGVGRAPFMWKTMIATARAPR